MEVFLVLALRRNYSASANGRFCNHVVKYCPIVFLFLQVRHPWLFHTVAYADIDTSWAQYAVDLWKHLVCIWTRAIAAKDRIDRALVNNSIKGAIFKLKLPNITLFVNQSWVFFFVQFLHLLDHSETNVNVCLLLITIVKHLFRDSYTFLETIEYFIQQTYLSYRFPHSRYSSQAVHTA